MFTSRILCFAFLVVFTLASIELAPAQDVASATAGQTQQVKRNIVILATGGTIAGAAATGTQSGYQSGAVTIDAMIAAVPDIGKNANMALLGKADTNWTQQGSFEAMSSFLSQHPDIDAVLYEYADGFRGGVRAYEAAQRDMDVILTLRTDEQGLFCDWEKVANPNFKIFFSSGGTFQVRIALTSAMAKLRGEEIPAVVDVPFKMKQVQSGMCNQSLPQEIPVSSLVDADMLAQMFQK